MEGRCTEGASYNKADDLGGLTELRRSNDWRGGPPRVLTDEYDSL